MSVSMNLLIEQGADFTKTIIVTESNGAIKDLTGYTFGGTMRRAYRSVNYTDFDISCTQPETGAITFGMASAVSAALTPGRYIYDIYMYSGDSPPVSTRVVEGIVTISPSVTKLPDF